MIINRHQNSSVRE